jgi:hypothetical protein
LENRRHVGPVCQRLCRHAECPDWPSKAASLVSVRAAKRRPRQHAVLSPPCPKPRQVTGPNALHRHLIPTPICGPKQPSPPLRVTPRRLLAEAAPSPAATASSLLCPTVDPDELAENLFPEAKEDEDAAPPLPATEETLVAVPGAQLHLVDPDRSIDLGAGTLSIVRLLQGGPLGRFRPCLITTPRSPVHWCTAKSTEQRRRAMLLRCRGAAAAPSRLPLHWSPEPPPPPMCRTGAPSSRSPRTGNISSPRCSHRQTLSTPSVQPRKVPPSVASRNDSSSSR